MGKKKQVGRDFRGTQTLHKELGRILELVFKKNNQRVRKDFRVSKDFKGKNKESGRILKLVRI